MSQSAGKILSTIALMWLSGCMATPGSDPVLHARSVEARDIFMRCAFARGAVLASSNEAPESVATAAISSCGLEEAAALEALRADAQSDSLALAVRHRLVQQTREGIIELVVNKRSKIP